MKDDLIWGDFPNILRRRNLRRRFFAGVIIGSSLAWALLYFRTHIT